LPTTDIVIVNWNSGKLLRRCLTALADCSEPRQVIGRVVVVDNASVDGSADVADLAGRLPLDIVKNVDNRGFAAACNLGAARGESAHVLFLNPDVEVLDDTLRATTDFLAAGLDQRIGIVGIRLVDSEGTTQRCTASFPSPRSLFGQSVGLDRLFPRVFTPPFNKHWDHQDTRDVDQVMGAFLMIRRDVLDLIKGFDERFFVYYEDMDLCLRVKAEGWRSVHFSQPTAFHEGQGTTRNVKDIRLFYFLRSRLLYARKHFGAVGWAVVFASTLILEPVARIFWLLMRGRLAEIGALARGYKLLLSALPYLVGGRSRPANQAVSRFRTPPRSVHFW
jgi:N-acetylglucosaminyl-diphospho-decaprenol L-rhamnosyltransferase